MVGLTDGVVAHSVVDSVAISTKTRFPSPAAYGPRGGSSLQRVTCGGTFDNATGSYLSNVVAYTSLVGVTPPVAPASAGT